MSDVKIVLDRAGIEEFLKNDCTDICAEYASAVNEAAGGKFNVETNYIGTSRVRVAVGGDDVSFPDASKLKDALLGMCTG